MFDSIFFVLLPIVLLIWHFRENLIGIALSLYFGTPLPKYSYKVERNVSISMRDGICLKADIYRPKKAGKYPAMISHTPYEKENTDHFYTHIGRILAGQGFVFVIQDVRGKRPSEGNFYPHLMDASDGADTIDWVVKQPWSDQQVALFGFSALGLNAWLAAIHSKHKISTVLPWFASSTPYAMWYENGVLYLKQLVYWMARYGASRNRKIDEIAVDKVLEKSDEWQNLDIVLTKKPIPAYRDFLKHNTFDSFWQKFSIPLEQMEQDMPVLLGSGWYDQFLLTTIADFQKLMQFPEGSLKKASHLILGPWIHIPTRKIASLHLSEDAHFKHQFPLFIKWLQRWMGTKEPFTLPPVTYYLMGRNVWLTTHDWPPPECLSERLYLDCKNSTIVPQLKENSRCELKFKPSNFVPAIGGHMLYGDGKDGPQEQSYLLKRNDVLLWTSSQPLEKDLAVVGSARLRLILSCSLPSFDLAVKLIDVTPEGQMQLVTDGYRRFDSWIPNQQPYEAEIHLIDTAYVFKAGHRLQLAVTHSDFPAYEPNGLLLEVPEATLNISSSLERPSSFDFLVLS